MKKVLILGAGLVSRPHVNYLLAQKDFMVTVASRTVNKAEKLVADHPNGTPVELNVTNDAMLEKLVSEHDLSVSLLPYTYHVKVAKLCIKHRKHMVTTSYVSDAMRALDEDARDADVLILNEIGVDPGIDHMSAMRVIDGVKENNGRILSFRSYCGGLPAPEANTNPWGYKFSWSPRGVVMAGKNASKWLEDGKIVDVPGPELFAHRWEVEIPGFGKLEGYPNRNSVPYVDIYSIKDTNTMFRGTLRYPGWCATMKKIVDLGILDDEQKYDLDGLTYADFMEKLVTVKTHKILKENLAAQWDLPVDSNPIYRVEWLGLFSDNVIGLDKGTAMDVFCNALNEKLTYEPDERDLLVLHHEFIAEFQDKKQHITSTMIDYGIPNGDSSMSRTVGLPASIAVKLILEGKIQEKGVKIPVDPEIYLPVLDELKNQNIECVERFEDM